METKNETNKRKWVRPVLITTAAVVLYILFSKDTSEEYEQEISGSGSSSAAGGLNVTDLAQKLHDAMKYTGTKEEVIFDVLTNIDERQFQLIAKRFGKRAYNSLLGNQTRINPFAELPKLTLKEWFKHELTESEYKTLQAKYPNSL